MSKSTKQRRKLFRHFSKNLSLVDSAFEGKFVCPLCAGVFVESDTAPSNNMAPALSKAHIWSDMLGQTKWTLACSKCNSDIGSKLEGEEAKRIRTDNGAILPRVRYSVEGIDGHVELPIHLKVGDDGSLESTIYLNKAVGEKKTLREIEQYSRQNHMAPFHLSFREPFDARKANLTYLHGAFLHLFHQFGYAFLSTGFATKIRQQLWNPEGQYYPFMLETSEELEGAKLDEGETHMFIVVKPEHLIGFLVLTPRLRAYGGKRKAIFLPVLTPTLSDATIFDIFESQKAKTLTFVPIRDLHSDLATEEYARNLVTRVFNAILKSQKTGMMLTTEPPTN